MRVIWLIESRSTSEITLTPALSHEYVGEGAQSFSIPPPRPIAYHLTHGGRRGRDGDDQGLSEEPRMAAAAPLAQGDLAEPQSRGSDRRSRPADEPPLGRHPAPADA